MTRREWPYALACCAVAAAIAVGLLNNLTG